VTGTPLVESLPSLVIPTNGHYRNEDESQIENGGYKAPGGHVLIGLVRLLLECLLTGEVVGQGQGLQEHQ